MRLYGRLYCPTISIHALREEGDKKLAKVFYNAGDFYPRPPRGGRRVAAPTVILCAKISIHALREEGDTKLVEPLDHPEKFLSTPSARRATFRLALLACSDRFLSTPSARRATCCSTVSKKATGNFYPRPPRGGRQQKQRQNLYFQTNYTTFCTNLEEP